MLQAAWLHGSTATPEDRKDTRGAGQGIGKNAIPKRNGPFFEHCAIEAFRESAPSDKCSPGKQSPKQSVLVLRRCCAFATSHDEIKRSAPTAGYHCARNRCGLPLIPGQGAAQSAKCLSGPESGLKHAGCMRHIPGAAQPQPTAFGTARNEAGSGPISHAKAKCNILDPYFDTLPGQCPRGGILLCDDEPRANAAVVALKQEA